MKLWLSIIIISAAFLLTANNVFAASNSDVQNFTSSTLQTLIILASIACAFFLVRGGYMYITSSGKPDSLEHAKQTIKNAMIGLVLVVAAAAFSSFLNTTWTNPTNSTTAGAININPISTVTPSDGLTQVLIDAIAGFLQNIIQSATAPLTSGIISFLTTTPSLASNSVIFNFWLVILGITDSLFAIIIALLGFHFMSATTFGFEEIELKHLLPRIGLAFIGANTSLFIADWIVQLCNMLITAVLNATGGIASAWILNAFNPTSIITGGTALITLIFMILFVLLAVVLLLFYVSRLITVALGAVLSPLIFLLWAIPKFADFAEVSIKAYIMTVFSVFIHVIIIQLASSFLTIPGQSGTNSLISILIGIGLFFTLLKTQSFMIQLIFYNTGGSLIKKVGGQIVNMISTSGTETKEALNEGKKLPRKVVEA